MAMAIRDSVREFVELGPLPDSRAPEDVVARHQLLLQRISGPIADDEAALLVNCFGPDDCYGLAWTLLHLIESASGGTPIKTEPGPVDNEWVQRLWNRSNK